MGTLFSALRSLRYLGVQNLPLAVFSVVSCSSEPLFPFLRKEGEDQATEAMEETEEQQQEEKEGTSCNRDFLSLRYLRYLVSC